MGDACSFVFMLYPALYIGLMIILYLGIKLKKTPRAIFGLLFEVKGTYAVLYNAILMIGLTVGFLVLLATQYRRFCLM